MSAPPPSRRRTWRERLRTGTLLGYALLCLAFTLPGGSRLVNRQVWDSAHNRDQFTQWASTLQRLGIDVEGEGLKQRLWRFTRRYVRTHAAFMRPMRWLPEQLGFGQSWRMFSNPQTTPSRLWVEVNEGSGFKPVYISRSPTHAWRRSFFEHHRVRKLLGRIGRGGRDRAYRSLAAWVGQRALDEFPTAREIRVRVYTWNTPSPTADAPLTSDVAFTRRKGKFRRELVFTRGDHFE